MPYRPIVATVGAVYKVPMKLADQRVLVIGGSSGIGLGIATAAATGGAFVVIAGRSPERLAAARASLPRERSAVEVLDVTAEAQVRTLLKERQPPFDHIAITAATAYVERVVAFDLDRVRQVLEAKIVAAIAVAKHARLRAGGSLLLTAGINALRPMPGVAAVSAANGGLIALGRALAVELAPLRVNVLSPGWVDTPIWDAFGPGEKERRLAEQATRLPTRRVGTPQDLGEAAVFAMANGFVTGTVLEVDGGHRLV